MKIFYLLFILNSYVLFSLGNQKAEELEKKINLVAIFDGKIYEFFTLGGKTDTMFYGKDPFLHQFDSSKNRLVLLDNPVLFQTHTSFLPHPLQNSVKSIQYIPVSEEKLLESNQRSKVTNYFYGHKEWLKVKIIFTNGEERLFLLPGDIKISLYDAALSATVQIDVSCLKEPLIIEEIKCQSNKK